MHQSRRVDRPKLTWMPKGVYLVLLTTLLTACPKTEPPPTPEPPGPGEQQMIETPAPDLEPANGAPTFPGTEYDAFGMQTTPADADDDPGGLYQLNAVTNPLNVFGGGQGTFEPFLLVRDIDNPLHPQFGRSPSATARWTFDVSGFTDLTLEVDIAAKGDFEADDRFTLTYKLDDGAERPALNLAVDEAAVQTYTVHVIGSEKPVEDTLFDPLVITDDSGAKTATNTFKTYRAKLTGEGDTLTLELRAVQDGGAEMLALKNVVVEGTISD